METSEFSDLFIELQDILTEFLNKEIALMSYEKIKRIKEKYGEKNKK